MPLIAHFSAFLDPLGRALGMDGVILCAFILALPANEIVLPLCAMMYSSSTVLSQELSVSAVLASSGWSVSCADLRSHLHGHALALLHDTAHR